MQAIRFGTEGWRAVLADQYTFTNVRAVAKATASWLKGRSKQCPVAVGHDTRFMGGMFASAFADELAAGGIDVRLCSSALPTPAVCTYGVMHHLAGSAILTASHNPSEYNGVKVKNHYGASIEEEEAKWIGAEANRLLESGETNPAPPSEHERFDAKEEYLERLLSLVDRDTIANAALRVVADTMHGAACGWFDEALRRAGCAEVRGVRPKADPTFGGSRPEPIGPNLEASIPLTADPQVHLGLATDGDGDRFGMMVAGEYIDIQRTIAFILYHLLKNRGWRGRVVRAINVTSMVDRLCAHFGCEVTETPVGFKNIAPEIIADQDVILGVEESGGFGIKGHIPDRDGTLTALTACEATAVEAKPALEILDDIFALVGGRLFYGRYDLRLADFDQRERVAQALDSVEPQQLAGEKVDQVKRIDGAKIVRTDGAWLLMRLSGTEPLVRIYSEGRSEDQVEQLLGAGRELVVQAAERGAQ